MRGISDSQARYRCHGFHLHKTAHEILARMAFHISETAEASGTSNQVDGAPD
jgi:hypothetical protein